MHICVTRSRPGAKFLQVTVMDIANATGLTRDAVKKSLQEAGFTPVGDETTIGQLSEQQNRSPHDALDAIRDRHPGTPGRGRITGQRGGGWH